jgi:DNA-binding MarR family transcriptional regulator
VLKTGSSDMEVIELNVSESKAQLLIKQLMLVNKSLAENLDKELAKTGLKKASFEVLSVLFNSGEPYSLTPNELLEKTHITSGSMTSRIDKLAKKKWVERVVNKKDKRSVKVQLTKSGKAVIQQAISEHENTLINLLSVLTEREQQRLSGLLLKFLAKSTS